MSSGAGGRGGLLRHLLFFFLSLGTVFFVALLLTIFVPEKERGKNGESHIASMVSPEGPTYVKLTVSISPSAVCAPEAPMTLVQFVAEPPDSVMFRLVGTEGLAVDFPPGAYPLANGKYSWSSVTVPGYSVLGPASGDIEVASPCATPYGSGTPYDVPTAADVASLGGGASTTESLPTEKVPPVLPESPTVTTDDVSVDVAPPDDDAASVPRPVLRFFVDNSATTTAEEGVEVELRVSHVMARSVKFARQSADGTAHALGNGAKDDLLSEPGEETWVYFWDTSDEPAGRVALRMILETKEGTTVATDPIPFTITARPHDVAIQSATSSSVVLSEALPVTDPLSCTSQENCLTWCASSPESKKECSLFAIATGTPQDILPGRFGVRAYLDSDADGIVDFDEVNLYGTDPDVLDSDADGVSDRDEVLVRAALSGDREEVSGIPLIQDDLSLGESSPLLSVSRIASANLSEEDGPQIYGSAPPNSVVTIIVFSRPFVSSVLADAEGRYKLNLPREFPDGTHTAYAAIVDTFGTVLAHSSEFTFVKDGPRVGRIHGNALLAARDLKTEDLSRYLLLPFGLVLIVIGSMILYFALGRIAPALTMPKRMQSIHHEHPRTGGAHRQVVKGSGLSFEIHGRLPIHH